MALAALESKPSADEPTRGELLLALGDALARSGEMRHAEERFVQAADVARRIGRPELLARAAIGYGGRFVWVRSGGDKRLVPLLQDALEALPEHDSVLPVKLLARLAGALRDLPSARPVAAISREALEMARRLGDPATLAYALDGLYAGSLSKILRVLFAGRFEEAETLLERNRELGLRAQTGVTYTGAHVLILFVLRREQGRLEEVEDPLTRCVHDHPEPVVFRCALAALRYDLGRYAHAADLLEELAGDDFADLPSRQEWLFGAGLLAEVCVGLGDRRRAATLYELLLPYRHCNLLNWVEVCVGSVSRYLGLLATTMSRWPDAERHFEEAIEMDTRTGGRPWLAHTQLDYAGMLLARARSADGDRARELAAGARATFQQLGMEVHAARAERLFERVTGQAAAG
jgi:tetratricopeptide (TPR) repeat protein